MDMDRAANIWFGGECVTRKRDVMAISILNANLSCSKKDG